MLDALALSRFMARPLFSWHVTTLPIRGEPALDQGGLKRKSFNADVEIFSAGQPADKAYLIVSGCVNIVSRSRDDCLVLDTLVTGDIFGEMALFVDQPRTTSAVATEPTNCVVITKSDFQKYFDNAESFTKAILRLLSKRLQDSSALQPAYENGDKIKKKRGAGGRSVSASISIPELTFDLLRDVALVRSFGRKGNTSVTRVILDTINKNRGSLEQEAEKLRQIKK